MKFLVAFLVILAIVCCTALDDASAKKTDKRGLFGLGYGYHQGPYYGGYGGYGHGYDYHSFSHGHSHYPHNNGYFGHGYFGHYPYGGHGYYY